VRKFEVVGSTVLSAQEIVKVLESYTLRPISFAELLEAQKAITQLYIDNGYITSGAFIPPQAIRRGVVRIEVIEGEVESIEITGLERLNPDYIRSRLAIALKAPLIANLSAELAAGSRPGVSLLKVQLREADAISVQLSLDNQRSPSVGTDRRQVQFAHNNLLGFGDRFLASYINTDGSNSLNELSYTIPVNAFNGTIGGRFSYTDNENFCSPFFSGIYDSKRTGSFCSAFPI
jgi:hemolysin activation/secretion protein